MDSPFVKFMAVLTLVLAAGVGYAVYSLHRTRREVAWNVVNAALALRRMSAEQISRLENVVLETLPETGIKADAFLQSAGPVRLAFLSMAMYRQGIEPVDASHPFRPLRSAFLARSVGPQLAIARMTAEAAHGVTLTELDVVKPDGSRPSAQSAQ
jgi:hypothetical protein